MAEGVADLIQLEITELAGPRGGRRRNLILLAVVAAANMFYESLASPTTERTGVEDLFRRMGYGEASDGHDLTALESAIRIGQLSMVTMLWQRANSGDVPVAALPDILEELGLFAAELTADVRTGGDLFAMAQSTDDGASRRALVRALVKGDAATVATMAARLGWTVPAEVVVMAVQSPLVVEWPQHSELAPAVVDDSSVPALLVVDKAFSDDALAQVRRLNRSLTVARSWPVRVDEAMHARRWTTRALHLVSTGAIPRQPVVECARYFTQLWLQAEPALRADLVQILLAPLLAETANSREILSHTLLAWLRSRDSAPIIAEILGVHPQTVRYRWRKINELFGEALQDPTYQLQLLMVLEASIPLWTAGDLRDLERYRRDRGLRGRR